METIKTKEEFASLVEEIKSIDGYREPIAFGIARVDRGQKSADKVLQANYAIVNWKENYGSGAVFIKALLDAKKSIDFSDSEFVATINDNFV